MTVQVKVGTLSDESQREPFQRFIASQDLDQIYSELEPDLVVEAVKRTQWPIESVAKSMIGLRVMDLYLAQSSSPPLEARLDVSL